MASIDPENETGESGDRSSAIFWRGSGQHVGQPWAWQDKTILTVVVIEENNTREQAAKRLGCSVETLDKWVRKHGLDEHPDAFTK